MQSFLMLEAHSSNKVQSKKFMLLGKVKKELMDAPDPMQYLPITAFTVAALQLIRAAISPDYDHITFR